ncbi:MAG: filamentous hemagglutinin N-terminal domain-containing protein, partial [Gammaproteobacteria bacterium]
MLLCASGAWAGPHGGQVVRGIGDISTPSAGATLVNQHSDRLVIDWRSFNLAPTESVTFNQPRASSAALNRIFDQNPSRIFGSIRANGRVFLLNPNGIIFGSSASVNVGSLFATTLGISADEFMDGHLHFAMNPDQAPGIVVNRGLLAAARGGSVSLVGGRVENDGLILAELGQVNLASGTRATVDFDGDGLIRFEVDGAVESNPDAAADAVSNRGMVSVGSGQVLMTAHTAKDVFAHAVNNEGVIRANGIVRDGGTIRLVGSGGNVANSGDLQARSEQGDGGRVELRSTGSTLVGGAIDASGGRIGGRVHVLGDSVSVHDADVQASGDLGGGEILVGGDRQGGGGVQAADNTDVDAQSHLAADAGASGNGGKVVVWSNGTTRMNGDITARGGAGGGDGGRVEVSGRRHLQMSGHVDLRAPAGNTGDLLLDPGTVYICDDANAATCNGTQNGLDTFSDDYISGQLATTNLTIRTADATGANGAPEDIIFQDSTSSISWSTSNSLTLTAGHNIVLDGTISAASGQLVLNFGQTSSGTLDLSAAGLSLAVGTVTASANVNGGDTLMGANAAHTWTVSGSGSGSYDLSGMTFSGIENLVGGTAADTFAFTGGTSALSGTLDGGGASSGSDTLDYTGRGSAVSVDLQAGTATAVTGGFSNLTQFIGDAVSGNSLTLENTATAVSVNGSSVNGMNGTADDGSTAFGFQAFDTLTGGTGSNSLTGANTANAWTVSGSSAGTLSDGTGTLSFSNIGTWN